MRKTLLFMALAALLAACALAVPTTQDVSNPPAPTATPGSMTADNPEAAHMMEPISAPNVPLATETEGGQPLTFREEDGVKVFELTTKAVQWPILDGTTISALTYNGTVPGMDMSGAATEQGAGKYAINANFSMSGNWKLKMYVRKEGLDYSEEIDLPVQ